MNDEQDGMEPSTPRSPETRPRIPGWIVLVFYLVMGGLAAVFSFWILDRNPFRPIPGRLNRPLVDLGLGVGIGVAVVIMSQLMDRWFEWSRSLTHLFRSILGQVRRVDALIIAVASAVGEEILFRGVLLPTAGLVASSLIFGLLHGLSFGEPREIWRVLKQFAPLMVIATGLGFAFGLAVDYTGGILVSVVAHFTINFLNLSLMYQETWRTAGGGHGDG